MPEQRDCSGPPRRWWGLGRSLAAFDRGQIVGTAAAFPFDITLPGLTTVPAAGISWVASLPTHRRRGVLTRLMRHQLDDLRERGEPLAVLLASEGAIYGRFGYGVATVSACYRLERAHAGLTRRTESPGRLVLADVDMATKVLPEIHDRSRRLQPGDLTRPAGYWSAWFRGDAPRGGAGARFHVVYESDQGGPEGYASYRISPGETSSSPGGGNVVVNTLAVTTAEAYAALWRFLCDVDLTATIEARNRPLDEPLRWMLADPSRLAATIADQLWLRLVDLPTALAARRYAIAGALVVEVADPFCPWNEGRWSLEADDDGVACGPTERPADLALDAADLGAAYLGGTRLSSLARAGKVDELTAGALGRADRMFSCQPMPWCQTYF